MSNLLTNSRLRCYRECAYLHHLAYELGWRPVRDGEAISFGSLVHRGLEAWWKAEPNDDRLFAAHMAVLGKARDEWEAVKAEEVLRGYDARWAGEMDAYDVLAVEESFTSALVNPATGVSSRTWLLAGKVDGIVLERRTGRKLLVEHKTTSEDFRDPGAHYWERLHLDTQVSHYVIGAARVGHMVEGVLYDVLRRPQLRPHSATPENKRKYKKDGALYANQREQDETVDEYQARLRADIKENSDRYFARQDVARMESDLDTYLGDTWDVGRIIHESDPEHTNRHSKNPDACHRFGTCWAWMHCAYGERLEDHPDRYRRLEDVHPELAEETTA